MANRDVSFRITANSENAANGLKKISGQLKTIDESARGIKLNNLAKIGSVVSGANAAFGMCVKAVKAVNAAINDLTESYKTQAKAEIQLETAARNSPYLNESSVRQLKNYASELQSISTVGDETLIPMMARLAAAGRTQSEIQDVMSAALDLSASGTMSLEQAVTSLNATYQGSAGLLGRQNSAIKSLTAEQLKNGEAVKIIAEQYKGMAAETANATGSAEQLKNAWGDFKENIGKGLEKAIAPVRRGFTDLLTTINTVISRSKELSDANKNISAGKATSADYDVKIEQAEEKLQNYRKSLEKYKKEYAETGIDNGIAEVSAAIQEQLDLLRVYHIEKGKIVSTTQEQVSAEKQIPDSSDRAADLQKILDKYDAAIAKAELEADVKGEAVSEQTKLNAAMSTYLELAADPRFEKEAADWKQKTAGVAEAAKLTADIAAAREKFGGLSTLSSADLSPAEQIQESIAALKSAYSEYMDLLSADSAERVAAQESLNAKLSELNEAFRAAEREADENATRARLAEIESFASQVGSIISNAVSGIKEFASIAQDAAENEAATLLAELEEQRAADLVSEDEYNERKARIEKEAAQKSYRAQMWAWSAQLVQATANIALAAIQTLADPTIPSTAVRVAMMAAISAAGAAQIASAVASKPTPPSFAAGGIVQGSSYTGDNVRANVNSGEMILNAAQQKALWEVANGKDGGGRQMKVQVINNASNTVSAQPQLDEDGLKLFIDMRVKESMSKGAYNSEMTAANQLQNGVYYG